MHKIYKNLFLDPKKYGHKSGICKISRRVIINITTTNILILVVGLSNTQPLLEFSLYIKNVVLQCYSMDCSIILCIYLMFIISFQNIYEISLYSKAYSIKQLILLKNYRNRIELSTWVGLYSALFNKITSYVEYISIIKGCSTFLLLGRAHLVYQKPQLI